MRPDPRPILDRVAPVVDTFDGFAIAVVALVLLTALALVCLWAAGVLR